MSVTLVNSAILLLPPGDMAVALNLRKWGKEAKLGLRTARWFGAGRGVQDYAAAHRTPLIHSSSCIGVLPDVVLTRVSMCKWGLVS